MSTHIKTLVLILGVMVGIVLGEKSLYASEVAVVGSILCCLQGVLYFFERRKNTEDSVVRNISFSLCTMLFSFGLVAGIIRVQLVSEKEIFVCENVCTFSAKIISSPEIKNEYQVFVVRPTDIENEILDIQVRTTLYPRYSIGDVLLVSGKVTPPSIILPHRNAKDTRAFDYATYLHNKNIGSQMMYPRVEIKQQDEVVSLREHLGKWKEDLINRNDMYIRSPASSLSSGMLFGATSMSKELTETFRVAGLSHIVVLSGFNIAIVITAILFVLSFVPLFIRIILAGASVILFVLMVGGEPSVVRATIMAFIGLLALATGRQYVARQALLLSFLVIILYLPSSLLHDVSLHLSFLATAGIVYMSGPISSVIEKYIRWVKRFSLQEILVTTLCAYLATLPYVMYTFGTVSLYALIANIFVIPFVPIAMLLSTLVVLSSYVSHTASVLFGFIDTILITGMIGVAEIIEALPLASLSFTVSLVEMVLVYILGISFAIYVSLKSKSETHYKDKEGNLTDIIKY